MANDQTNATVVTHLDGLYGEVGSQSADNICISLLLPERLKDQFCFRTGMAVESLIPVERENAAIDMNI